MTVLAYIGLGLMVLNAFAMVAGKDMVSRVSAALGLAVYLPLIARVLGWL